MSDIPERTQQCPINLVRLDNLTKEVANLKEELQKADRRNDTQEEMMVKFDTVMEFMVEDRKEQKILNEKTTNILDKININLSELNKDMKDIEGRLSKVEDDSSHGKIDVNTILKQAITAILVGGIGYGLVYAISNMNM